MKTFCFIIVFVFIVSSNLYASKSSDFESIKTLFLKKDYAKTIELIDSFFPKYKSNEDTGFLYLIKGESLYYSGRYEESIKFFQDILKKSSQGNLEDETLISIGRAYFKLKKYKEAVFYFEKSIKKYPLSKTFEESQIWLADSYFELNNYKQALNLYDIMVSKFSDVPHYSRIIFYAAICAEKIGDYEKSLNYTNKVLELKNKDYVASALNYKAKILILLKRFKEAIEVYENINTENSLIEEAYLYYSLKDFDESLKIIQKLLNEFPKTKFADNCLYLKGLCYFKKKDFILALNEYSALLRDYENSPFATNALINKGVCFFNLEKYKEAISVYDEAISKFPNSSVKAYYNKAWALISLGKSVEAADVFEKLIKKFPKNILVPDVLFWLAYYYDKNEDLDKSLSYLEKIVKNYKDESLLNDAYEQMSDIAISQGKIDLALEFLKNIKEKDPEFFETQIKKADIFFNVGKSNEAYEILKYIFTLNIDKSLKQEVSLRLGEILAKDKKWGESIFYFKQAQVGMNVSVEVKARKQEGEALMHLKQYKEALDVFKNLVSRLKLLGNEDIYFETMLDIGWCYEKLKDKKQAIFIYSSIIKESQGKYIFLAKNRMAMNGNHPVK